MGRLVTVADEAYGRGFRGLAAWLKKAESIWVEHRSSKLSFVDQLDYYGKLSSQEPFGGLMIVFAASGTMPAAAIVNIERSVIEHALYWLRPKSKDEAAYLCTILNSETTRRAVERIQARGQWGARHFDKVVFTLPIPYFSESDSLHLDLVQAAAQAERVAAKLNLSSRSELIDTPAGSARRWPRTGIAAVIDDLVRRLFVRRLTVKRVPSRGDAAERTPVP